MIQKHGLLYYCNVLIHHPDYIYKLISAVTRHPLTNVEIEINSQCNRKCPFCPNSTHDREIAYMDERLYHRIINELKEMRFEGRLTFIGYNEPLLDERLPAFIAYASKQLPTTYFYLPTNGDLLDLSIWQQLRAAGLDLACVSQYDGRLNDNIVKLLNDLTEEEKKHIFVRIFDVATEAFNRAGLVKAGNMDNLPLKEFCMRPFYGLVINYKGKAVVCCNDYLGQVETGDANHQHIADIWESKIFRTYRKKLLFRDRASLTLCNTCNFRDKSSCLPTYEQRVLQPLKKRQARLLKDKRPAL
jgi:MoaA/NifB/PqqE/SkfB family radical SAM enzyme